MDSNRREASAFWAIASGGPVAIGALLAIVGLNIKPQHESMWREPWFDVGLVLATIGLVVLGWSLWLRLTLGRSSQEPTLSPLEQWLQSRLEEATAIVRQRLARGNSWYFNTIGEWDVANVNQMALGDDPVAPELVDNYRRNRQTGLVDGPGPPHDTAEYDRYYDARLAWVRHAFQASRDGTSITTPLEPEVPEAHRLELQGIAAGLEQGSIPPERQASYHPPGQDGTQALAKSFRTHFPSLARMLDEWNSLVTELNTAQRAMWDWTGKEWGDRSFPPPPVSVYSQIAERGGDSLPWVETDWLMLGGLGIVQITEGVDLDEVKRPYDDFLDEALSNNQAAELRRLRARVDAANQTIREQLELIQARRVIRGKCDLCR